MRAVDNAREIHRGGKCRLKGPEIAGTLPPLADQFQGFPAWFPSGSEGGRAFARIPELVI
jgi:hypothetical protein